MKKGSLSISFTTKTYYSEQELIKAINFGLGYGYQTGFTDAIQDSPEMKNPESKKEGKKIAKDYIKNLKNPDVI